MMRARGPLPQMIVAVVIVLQQIKGRQRPGGGGQVRVRCAVEARGQGLGTDYRGLCIRCW